MIILPLPTFEKSEIKSDLSDSCLLIGINLSDADEVSFPINRVTKESDDVNPAA